MDDKGFSFFFFILDRALFTDGTPTRVIGLKNIVTYVGKYINILHWVGKERANFA